MNLQSRKRRAISWRSMTHQIKLVQSTRMLKNSDLISYLDGPRYHGKSFNSKEPETDGNSNNEHMSFTLEDKPGRETSPRSDATSADKNIMLYKVSDAEVAPTSITDHMMEENVIEVNEKEEYLPEVEDASEVQDLPYLPPPPPPPFIPQNIHPEVCFASPVFHMKAFVPRPGPSDIVY